MVLIVVLSVDGLLTALNDIYSKRPDAKSRPIKGYLQIVKIVLYIAAGILVVSTDPEKQKKMQLAELKNGRLAMIAIGGMVTGAAITGNGFPYLP